MSAGPPDDTQSQLDADFAAVWSSDGATRSLDPTSAGLPADLPFLFAPGQRFGPYTIVRPLGKGGMGQVYEAEEAESGRRIALKLLSRGIGDGEERERFLREGRLAASLSHPNCVYVFGTSEVQGFPVIAMELAPEGTLKDLIVPGAAMPLASAVDAILQVIAGLDAAAAIGILHRDIKPSNCFIDRDGRVMVGDFGLSIASGHDAGAAGAVMGTPGFASPEQLRGAPLDVGSDIYSVGATLYYLLTGRAPFDGPDLMTVITRVATETAPALSLVRADAPSRLNAVVAKCLAQNPADRYASYPALAAALEPFRSAALSPAPLGRRTLAGWIDSFAATLPLLPFNFLMSARIFDLERRGEALLLSLPTVGAALAYYAILEGRWGWSLGKLVLNLRVIDDRSGPPGIWKAFLRAVVFIVPAQALSQLAALALLRLGGPGAAGTPNAPNPLLGLVSMVVGVISLVVLFSTARRRNGFAALHDRASRTRVVLRPGALQRRERARAEAARSRASLAGAHIGPYQVSEIPAAAARPCIVEGFDDRLQRSVWIEVFPDDAPALASQRRDLSRAGRTRWLSGRRADGECWDAYEAIDGAPLLNMIAAPQPWSRVRHWVADLAGELSAGLADGSLPPLGADRIWITGDARARLLDWPAPGLAAASDAPPHRADLASAQRFLYGIAAGALRGVPPEIAAAGPVATPLPIPAREFLETLSAGRFDTAPALTAAADALLRQPASLPRSRRGVQLAACAAAPLVMVFGAVGAIQYQVRSQTANPAAYELNVCLRALVSIDRKDPATLTAEQAAVRDALETYITAHLREGASDYAEYARAFPFMTKVQREYAMAERVLAKQIVRSEDQVRQADPIARKVIAANASGLIRFNRPLLIWAVAVAIASGTAAVVAILGIAGALVARSGFTLWAFGAALVTATGADASRLRAFGRALVAWLPIALWLVVMKFTPGVRNSTVPLAMLHTIPPALLAAGALFAWRHPERGIQDRIAGTWIVPR